MFDGAGSTSTIDKHCAAARHAIDLTSSEVAEPAGLKAAAEVGSAGEHRAIATAAAAEHRKHAQLYKMQQSAAVQQQHT